MKFKAIFLFFSRIHATLSDSVGWSVSQLVGLLVGWSIHPSVRLSTKFLPKGYLNRIKAPAHPYATDSVVYTPLLMKHLIQTNEGTKVQ